MLNTNKPTPWEREQLAAWLQRYEWDRQLRDPTLPTNNATPEHPEPTAVACGQIRLLPPVIPRFPQSERPVFVLVFDSNDSGQTTIIPFGRFDLPATPQEWSTELEHTALKVLCFWNQRILQTEQLERTWLAGSLSGNERQTIAAAFAQSTSHRQHATKRHGPPLIHALDPRHMYLHEEKTLLDDEMDVLQASQKKGALFVYPLDESETEHRQAAEDGDEYTPDNEPD